MATSISQTRVNQFSAGISNTLNKIDANVVAQVWAEQLPVLGDNLRAAADGGATQLQLAANLGAAIKSGLDSLSGSASYTVAEVESAVNGALASAGFSGVGVVADFSTGSDLRLSFTTQAAGSAVTVAVENDLGLANLGFHTTGTAQTTVSDSISFTAGIDGSGFYVETGPGTTFNINTDTKLPGLNAAADLGGLGFEATDDAAHPTDFVGQFALILKDPGGDGRLRAAELTGDLIDATLSGVANVNLGLKMAVPFDSAMPQLATSLGMLWSFTDALVDPTDDNSTFGTAPDVRFNNSSINLGSFFTGFAGQVLNEINQVTAPFQPVIDILTTPIPILEDLGSNKVTLLDFAGLSANETAAIKGLADIAALASEISSFADASNVKIDLGSVALAGDLRVDQASDLALGVVRQATAAGNQNFDLGQFLQDASGIAGGGLSFPILSDYLTIGKLLQGQNVDLFDYQTTFGFDQEFTQFFPVLGPIGVKLGGHFGLSGTFDFGFDAQGARDYLTSGMVDPSQLFDGFYVRATDDAGNPVTGFQIAAGIIAGVEANLGIAEVGVDGDLTANIDFALNSALDPLGSGKIRGRTLISTPIADLFDPSGSLSAGLHAYLEVGISPFSLSFDFDSPRVVLLNFDGDAANPPILADELANGNLALNMGPRSANRMVGNLNDLPEKYMIHMVIDPITGTQTGAVEVDGFKFAEFHDAPNRIVGNGGEHADEIILDPDVRYGATLSGGLSRDFLTGGRAADILNGDEGPDMLIGNRGNDNLRGGTGADRLVGGVGADVLDGGDGMDTASYATAAAGMTIDLRTMTFTGDGAGDSFISIERFEGTNFDDIINGDGTANALLGGLDGKDVIHGFGNDDLLDGGKGDDELYGDAGNDLLIGGEGADKLDGGAGIDTVGYMNSRSPVTVSLKTGLGTGGDAQGDVLISIEVLIGSPLPFGDVPSHYDPFTNKPATAGTGDHLEGGDGDETISGLGGADFIDGGAGNDVLYGDAAGATFNVDVLSDFDADTLRGGLGNDKLYGQEGDDDLDGGAGQDILDGGTGDDYLHTFDLGSIDILDGGAGINRLSADYSDKIVPIIWISGQTNDYTFADGEIERNFQYVGELNTGNKADQILLDGAADDGYDNIIRTNGGADLVRAGAGADYVHAGAGDDFVNGGSNNVKLLFDGWGAVVGYTGAADELHGGTGNDTISFDQLVQYVTYLGIGTDNGKQFGLGVYVDLSTNTTGGAATGMIIDGFENIVGTLYGDNLIGDDGDNIFYPLRGGGLSSGSTGGPDRIDGKGGRDTLVIDFSVADVAESLGIVTNATSIYRNSIGNIYSIDSYLYNNIERLNITGASKADVLYPWVSVPDDDYLSGLGGNDILGGGGGADTLLGGSGDDTISAQGTFDLSYGGIAGGHDVITGGSGDDFIEDIAFANGSTALGADALFEINCGSGFDILSVDFSNQTSKMVWSSDAPTNLIFADGAYARGFEQLRYFAAGSGNDRITQLGRVDNIFYLGQGDDVVNAGLGNDSIDAGAGDDLVILDFSVLDTPDSNGVQGGGGGAYYRTLVAGGTRIDNIYVYNAERLQITGTSKNDSFAGNYGDDRLYGGAGNDVIDGWWGGNDYLNGGRGNDTLIGSMGWNGSGSSDTLIGGSGNDLLKSRTGDDKLMGGGGKDTLIAEFDFTNGFGTDTMSGGNGDDIISNITFNSGFGYAHASDCMYLDGGTGTDTLSADFSNEIEAINFISGTSNSMTFADGSYFRNFEQIADFISGDGNDELVQSGRYDNHIGARGGDDIVNPGLGIDTVYGGAGNDLLILDYSQLDTANLGGVALEGSYLVRRDINTNAVVDQIYAAEFERFQITGGSEGDRLIGGGDVDTLKGGDGDDIMRGNGGVDTIDGGTGSDTADYSDKFSSVVVALNGSNAVIVTVGGTAEDSIKRVENLIGGNAADTLTGDSNANTLDGYFGADTLAGMAGNDTYVVDNSGDVVIEAAGAGTDRVLTKVSYVLGAGQEIESLRAFDTTSTTAIDLTGNAGSQDIVGNNGNNRIDGGAGADKLTGGDGSDSFVFNTMAGAADTIIDFVSADDTILVAAAGFGGGLVAGGAITLVNTADYNSVMGAGPQFIYDQLGPDAGLYFDSNGGSGSDATLFAILKGTPSVIADDIVIF